MVRRTKKRYEKQRVLGVLRRASRQFPEVALGRGVGGHACSAGAIQTDMVDTTPYNLVMACIRAATESLPHSQKRCPLARVPLQFVRSGVLEVGLDGYGGAALNLGSAGGVGARHGEGVAQQIGHSLGDPRLHGHGEPGVLQGLL